MLFSQWNFIITYRHNSLVSQSDLWEQEKIKKLNTIWFFKYMSKHKMYYFMNKNMWHHLVERSILMWSWAFLCQSFYQVSFHDTKSVLLLGGALADGAFQEFNTCIFIRKLHRGRTEKRKHCRCYHYHGRKMNLWSLSLSLFQMYTSLYIIVVVSSRRGVHSFLNWMNSCLYHIKHF